MPRVKASGYVDHVAMTGALQQATGDHAAVAAFAVNGYGLRGVKVRQSSWESIERVPVGIGDVAALPLAFAADIEDDYIVRAAG